MRRPHARLAATCALAAATAVFTSTALADPGNGNSANAPGQVKQEQPAAQPQASQPTAQTPAPQTPAPQTQAPAPQQQAPGQQKKAATQTPTPTPAQAPAQSQSAHQAPGQAKKTTSSSSSSSSSGSSAGVKPANNTTHWTHCITGTSSSGATCTSS